MKRFFAALGVSLFSVVSLHAADDPNAKPVKIPDGSQRPAVEQKPITLAAPEAADAAVLQGKWQGSEVGLEANGACTLTVAGNTLHLQGWHQGEWYKATFTLPAGADPKQLQATITDCPVPEMVGKTSTAI